MLFSATLFSVSVVIFVLFADKSKFRSFLPTCYLAAILDLYTDLVTFRYPFWHYKTRYQYQQIIIHPLNTIFYFVATYLFLQTLPGKKSFKCIALHFIYWLIPTVSIELIAKGIGALEYGLGWNTFFSILADLILFSVFYLHYRATQIPKTKEAG